MFREMDRVSSHVILFSPCRVAVVSKSFEGQTDKTEEWYGTQYKQEAISEEVIKVSHAWSWNLISFLVQNHFFF